MFFSNSKYILMTGFAMFSMFFGAGNVVFPLGIGQLAKDQTIYATLGLLVSAIGVPFLGLFTMTLYNGDYKLFFSRLGPRAGFLITLFIIALIGPFGALPRCVALSFSTVQVFYKGISIELFSLSACVIIFLLTYKRTVIIEILGKFLTPFLLFSLAVIIFKGLFVSTPLYPLSNATSKFFFIGMKEGYQTMDLLGAFFFSSVIILGVKKNLAERNLFNQKNILLFTLASICIGAFLLALVYVGFAFVAAMSASLLETVPQDEMISQLALEILGPFAGIFASLAVALACLTTAIALASVSAEFIHKDLSLNKISYRKSLLLTMVITYFVSIMNFNAIAKMLTPILVIIYPSLIFLTFLNLLYKLVGFKPVKLPFFAFGSISLLVYFLLSTN